MKRAGADWWSLQPLKGVAVPPAGGSHWPRGEIDRFVLAALKAKGLKPSPEADRHTLIRRLHFDLHGLPPSPEDVRNFVADKSEEAYENLVDRLLRSAHYGERWARHWLDVVHYGESNGFEYNQPRNNAWPYRNWVVDALSADMPYDEFVRMQIAGDVIAPGTAGGVIATGCLVAGPHNTTLPQSDPMRKTMRQDELEDMVAMVSQTFLGLTVNCARCHDHKFDPITQTDYYRIAAALGGVNHGDRSIKMEPDKKVQALVAKLRIEEKQLRTALDRLDAPLRKAILAERKVNPTKRAAPPKALAFWDFRRDLRDRIGSMHAKLMGGAKRDASGAHVDGKRGFLETASLRKDLGEKTLEVWVRLKNIGQRGGGAITVQTRGGGIFDSIVFGEKESKRWMAGSNGFQRTRSFKAPPEEQAHKGPVHIAIVYEKDGTITGYRDGKRYGAAYRSPGLQRYKRGDTHVVFGVRHGTPGGNRMLAGTIMQARLYDRALSDEEIAASSGSADPYVTDEELLAGFTAPQRAKRKELSHRLENVHVQLNQKQASTKSIKVYATVGKKPPATHVLGRGSVLKPLALVSAGGIASLKAVSADFGLKPNASDGQRRRKLAEWITHPDNPLFARVIVNRLWHYHFGAGLVHTPNDFGFNGGRPSHPQLLDWLATEMKRRKWSQKAMHRLIVTSAAYRQSSEPNAQAHAVDADNRLLWRKSPWRIEAEALRDAILAVSGKLSPVVGGVGYRDVREYKYKGSHFYDLIAQDKPEQFRRTIYRFTPRGAKRTLLDTFDCPDPSTITPVRATTTTPLQSLALMNNAFVLRMADSFAHRLAQEAGDSPEKQVVHAYERAFGRLPDDEDLRLATSFIKTHGLAAYCRVLFNSNGFLYVR